jgi:protein phosphatase
LTTFDAAGVTHAGQVRAQNQDTFFVSDELVLIADGMGGYAGGEVAAAIAAEVVEASFEGNATPSGLEDAVLDANRQIFARGIEPGLEGMGTTLVAAGMVAFKGRTELLVVNVGDSRAYLLRAGTLRQLTEDHSVAAELVRMGRIDEGTGAEHPGRHVLTKVLGVDRDVEPDLHPLEPVAGDRLLLCSDGLSNELDDEAIASLLGVGVPGDAARALVAAANAHGGLDNITAVVADVIGDAVVGDDVSTAEPTTMAVPVVIPSDLTQQVPAVSAAVPASAPAVAPAEPSTMAVPVVLPGDRTDLTRVASSASSPVPTLAVRPVLTTWERFLRRREDRRRHRAYNKWVSIRGAVFLLMFAAVLVGAYLVLRWYGTQNYLVTFRNDHVVVVQGRTGGFLWWQPQVVFHERYGSGEVPVQVRHGIALGINEPTLAAARQFIQTVHGQWLAARGLGTVPSSTTTTIVSSNFTTTTAAVTGGT